MKRCDRIELKSRTGKTGCSHAPKERKKQLLYLDKSTPEEFQNAELNDWICFVGDISTQYELDFVRQFGHAMLSRPHPAPAQMQIDCHRCEGTMTPQPQQESIIDKMMQDYDCIFFPMCWRARELLYCPKKAGMVDCEDYRSRPHPAPAQKH